LKVGYLYILMFNFVTNQFYCTAHGACQCTTARKIHVIAVEFNFALVRLVCFCYTSNINERWLRKASIKFLWFLILLAFQFNKVVVVLRGTMRAKLLMILVFFWMSWVKNVFIRAVGKSVFIKLRSLPICGVRLTWYWNYYYTQSHKAY